MRAAEHSRILTQMRIRSVVWQSAVGVALASSTAAVSASDVPSRKTGDIHRKMTEEAAQCLVEKGSPVVVAWLNTLPGSAEESQLVSRNEALLTRCLRTSLAGMLAWAADYDYPAVRARIVQYVVKNGIVTLPAATPPGLARPNWFTAGTRGSLAAESIIANDLGFCLAKTNWPSVRQAVLAQPGSPEEVEHLRSLVPLVGGCIPPGTKLRMDLPRLRAVLDETAYHAAGGATAESLARPRAGPPRKPPVPGLRKPKADQ